MSLLSNERQQSAEGNRPTGGDSAQRWHRKEELPALSRHYTTISQLPRLRAYLSSDRIMPRNKLVTEPERKYVFVRGVGSVPPPDSPAAKGEL